MKKSLSTTAVIAAIVLSGSASAAPNIRYLIDTTSWNAGTFGAGLDTSKFFMLRTIGELAAADADGYTLLMPTSAEGDVPVFAVDNTYTSNGDVSSIKAWLEAEGDHNATGVKIYVSSTLTPGCLDTSGWMNAGTNLQPFSVTSACDTTAVDAAYANFYTIVTGNPNCVTDVVPAMRAVYAAPTGTNCLGYVQTSFDYLARSCNDQSFRDDLAANTCTDGTTGADAFCAFLSNMMPRGEVGLGPIYSANADGADVTYPTAAPATTTTPAPTPSPEGGTNAPGGAAGRAAPSALAVVAAVGIALASALLAP